MNITHTLRIAGYMVAIFMISLVACKKVDSFLGKYHLSLDSQTQNGKIYYSHDGNAWHLLAQDTIVKEGQYWFKAEPDAGYQFVDWGNLATLLGTNATTSAITVKDNISFFPTISQIKNEYTIALGTITQEGTGNGHIEYSTDAGGSWTILITTPVTLVAGTSIQFKAVADAGKFFWGWNEGIGGFEENPPAITLNNNLVISATFGDYKQVKVALIPSATNGYIQWSTNATTGFERLKTGSSYDSVHAGTIVYFEAMPNIYYQRAASNTWKISSPHTFIEGSTDGLAQVSTKITQEATITANFEKIKYTITVNDPGNGNSITYSTTEMGTYESIPPTPWQVDAGTTLYFKATPHTASTPYYRFDKWTGDILNNTTTSTTSIVVEKDITISTDFVRQYRINVEALPAGASEFKIKGTGVSSAGEMSTENFEVNAGDIGYFDEGTSITATATPITSDPDYYRFSAWDGTILSGTPGDGTNTSITMPNNDMSIPAPTFVRQYKLTINSLNTNGNFNTGTTTIASVAGNQPVIGNAGTMLNSSSSLLEGYFDAGTNITIINSPNNGYKLRFSIDGGATETTRRTSYVINNNTLMEGSITALNIDDSNPEFKTTYIVTFDNDGTGNSGRFADVLNEKNISFTLGNGGTITNFTIDSYTFTVSTPTIIGPSFSYTISNNAMIGTTPANSNFTLSFRLSDINETKGALVAFKIEPLTSIDGGTNGKIVPIP